jgi:Skp family chaperone for outer membrane proteins
MNQERANQTRALAVIQEKAQKLATEAKTEPVEAKKNAMQQQLLALQREFEDKQTAIKKDIDEKSAAHLRVLFGEIRTVVDAVAKTNGFDLVFSYPDAITAEEMNSPLYFELKLRPQAAMPFYVSPSVDITNVVVATLNKHYPAPGPIDHAAPGGVMPTGGAPPAGAAPGSAPPPMR